MQFLIDTVCSQGNRVSIHGADATHIAGSLRKKAGDTIVLRDCRGFVCHASIVNIRHERVECVIQKCLPPPDSCAFNAKLVLVQPLINGKYMNWVIQKAVELGVSEIMPVVADRCNIRPGGKAAESQKLRWERIVYEAYKQSEAPFLPVVYDLIELSELLETIGNEAYIMWFDRSQTSRRFEQHTPESPEKLYIVIGPEGGFSPREQDLLSQKSGEGISLGCNVLRSETASIAAISVAGYLFGPTYGGKL